MKSSQSDFVTVVSGLPRSGTSMMMRMLEAGGIPLVVDHERLADSDNPKGYFEFEAVKQLKEDSTWVANCVGSAIKVIYLLLYDLPLDVPYRVVFMRRDLDEILASQDVMIRRLGGEQQDIPKAVGREFRRMKTTQRMFNTHIAQIRDWLAEKNNFQVLEIPYQQVVSDPLTAANRVNAFLDGRLRVSDMAAAVDPDLYRQKSGNR